MVTNPKFSLVIPCFNEAKSLPALIPRVKFLADVGAGEVILVDNGSTDDTSLVLANLLSGLENVSTIRVEKNIGYGNGILEGLAISKSEVVGWTHADLQSDPLDVLRAINCIDNTESFFIKGFRHGRSFIDRFFSAGMSFTESILFGMSLREVNAQPTLFDKKLLQEWQSPPLDFSLDLFAYISAKQSRRRIIRIPVLFPPRQFGQSSWNDGFAARIKLSKRTISYSINLRLSPQHKLSKGNQ